MAVVALADQSSGMAHLVPDKPTLRSDEVSQVLACSAEHVRHLIEEGSLEAVGIQTTGSRPAYRVVRSSLVKFLRARSI